jgi:hypothetical protein
MSVDYADRMERCSVGIGSMSAALRAQRMLSAGSIQSTIIKTEGGRREGGCTYGLSVPCLQLRAAKGLLQEHGVRIRENT